MQHRTVGDSFEAKQRKHLRHLFGREVFAEAPPQEVHVNIDFGVFERSGVIVCVRLYF